MIDSPSELSVAMVSPEVAPLAKTGGLADVVGALPQALEKLGVKVSVIMPAYRSVLKSKFDLEDTGIVLKVPVSRRVEEASLFKTRLTGGIPVYLIRADKYFDRDSLYSTPEGDYPDNIERFTFFCRSALEVLRRMRPTILHAHDWQSALAIVFLKAQAYLYPELSFVKTLFTIHNLGYQGLFASDDWHFLNLGPSLFTTRYLEFHDRINILKGGATLADIISTVSPTYAEEIKTPEYGFGLEGVLEERSANLAGILNGADYSVWSPEKDALIPETFSEKDISGKGICKAHLQQSFGLKQDPEVPLIGMVSRLVRQKGFDLITEGVDDLLSRNVQFVLLGTGDVEYMRLFEQIALRHKGQMGLRLAFSEPLAHQIVAGSDFYLVPSRYEPAGLTQIYSLKYGTIPIVRTTGGLKDSVRDYDPTTGQGNGFVFTDYDVLNLLSAVDRAVAVYNKKEEMATIQKNAFSADFSWETSAKEYLKLYQKLAGAQKPSSVLNPTSAPKQTTP